MRVSYIVFLKSYLLNLIKMQKPNNSGDIRLKDSLISTDDLAFVMKHLIEDTNVLNTALESYFNCEFRFETDDFITRLNEDRYNKVIFHLNALNRVSNAAFVPPGTMSRRDNPDEEGNPFNRGMRGMNKMLVKRIRKGFEEWLNDPSSNPIDINVDFRQVRRDVERLNRNFRRTFRSNSELGLSNVDSFGESQPDINFEFVSNDDGISNPSFRPGISEDTPVVTIKFGTDLGFKFQSVDNLYATPGFSYVHLTFGKLRIPTTGIVYDYIKDEINRMLSQKLTVELRSRDSAILNFDIYSLVEYLNLIWLAYQIYYCLDSLISYFYGPKTNRNKTMLDLQAFKWPQELVDQFTRYRKVIQTYPIPLLMHEYAFWMTGNYQQSLNPSVGMCKIIPFAISVNENATIDFRQVTSLLSSTIDSLNQSSMLEQVMILERLNANEATIGKSGTRTEAKLTRLFGNTYSPEYSSDFLTCFSNLPLIYSKDGSTLAIPEYTDFNSTKSIYSISDKLDNSTLALLLSSGLTNSDKKTCSWNHNYFIPIQVYGTHGEMCNRFSIVRTTDGMDYTYACPVDDFPIALNRSETFIIDPSSKGNVVINPGSGREAITNVSYSLCRRPLELLTSMFFDLDRLIEGKANLRNTSSRNNSNSNTSRNRSNRQRSSNNTTNSTQENS